MPLDRWSNPSLPQTLQMGMFLLYADAVFGILFLRVMAFPLGTALVVGSAAAGLGIANEKRWGWVLGVGVSAVSALLWLVAFQAGGLSVGLSLLIAVAQFALLVHPQSRNHQKVWFS